MSLRRLVSRFVSCALPLATRRRMLVEALSACAPGEVADFEVGAVTGTGVRVPVVRPQAPLAGVAALPLHCPEAKEVSAPASA